MLRMVRMTENCLVVCCCAAARVARMAARAMIGDILFWFGIVREYVRLEPQMVCV